MRYVFVWLVSVSAAIWCWLRAFAELRRMAEQANSKLHESQRISVGFWNFTSYDDVLEEHQLLFTDSKPRQRVRTLFGAAILLFALVMALMAIL